MRLDLTIASFYLILSILSILYQNILLYLSTKSTQLSIIQECNVHLLWVNGIIMYGRRHRIMSKITLNYMNIKYIKILNLHIVLWFRCFKTQNNSSHVRYRVGEKARVFFTFYCVDNLNPYNETI